ncbi:MULTISPECIES: ATP-binding protein [unclassified Streptomyces]|uniref:ATP-binding protein n=1 Tax=unclassified Streptomyces TaxID=2593676 RepID=UPI0001C1A367|nr:MULTISPECIES: ATP-binding protein [unclassified Streptomyces]PZX35371.1 anti-sigma regulatory factor (Ser/Thr protein kinase) [Streptomyces sp. DvalAA-21]RAJ44548.1 anti-sigma regulatory factor (Ser/Thr protein kinase) [Streptomyces sp. DpondAA-A50]SCM12888.1 Anti-sigma regulatory factor (Ser/Thr protein kinase) [Streptomyces sp. DpondAA-F4]AEN10617.1 putative anti-sigma regulatory factor, serine/threonine protein kinase [Streptomyces sp. SirexAA-E]RAJ30102.1 anti-sigma regulatory factor (S
MTVSGTHPAGGSDEAVGGHGRQDTSPVRAASGVPQNAAAARALVTRLLAARAGGPDGRTADIATADVTVADVTVADALLVTSELVTNAFRHGGGLTGFAAEVNDEGLLLTVSDASSTPPAVTVRLPQADHIGGYGWPLVRRLTQRLTVTFHPGGKHIVALIALT